MKITYAKLRRLNACSGQLAQFKTRFGNSVIVTEELCLSVADMFNWDWAASRPLSVSAKNQYYNLKARTQYEYDTARNNAYKKYCHVKALNQEEYERVIKYVNDKYYHTIERNQEEYNFIKETAWKKRDRFNALNKDAYDLIVQTSQDKFCRAVASAFFACTI